MRRKHASKLDGAEKTVRDIRRATRKHHAAEEKIRIVLEGFRGEGSIAEQSDVEGAVVSGDPGRRRQPFLILVDNAIRCSQVHDEISVYLGSTHSGAVVRITDQRIGIAPDELDRVEP